MTKTTNQTIEIRDFRDEDREAVVAFENYGRPARRRRTVEGWELRDSLRTAEQVFLRRVVGDPAIAFLSVVDRNTTVWKKADVCDFEISVASADGPAARAAAFERCKPALRLHDRAQHCYADRSTVLASAIVSELEAWPTADAGWMKRFQHLETAFRAHVAKYDRR